MTTRPKLHVVAGIIYNAAGEILLTSRPEGKAYAGYWEFAGGKVEANESEWQALKREFQEELGIHIHHATPYLSKIHAYEHAIVHLRFFRVAAQDWTGKPQAHEGQQLAWQHPASPTVTPMLPANTHLLSVLAMPQQLSGSLNTSLYSHTSNYRILPYPADTNEANVMLSFAQLNALGKLPEHHHVWVIVDSLAQFQAAQDASAIIWQINTIQDAKTLLAVLQNGTALPIVAYATAECCQTFTPQWQTAGIQAIIENQDSKIA